MLGVVRSFPSFSAALDEIQDARVFGGIHFRSACVDGQATGKDVGDFILVNSFGSIVDAEQDGHQRDMHR